MANSLTAAAQKRLDKAAKSGGRVTLYAGSYDAPLYLRPVSGQPFVAGVEVTAPGPFSRLHKDHDGPFLVTTEAKDCLFQLPILGNGKGTGVEVRAVSSSSRLKFDRCHLQELETGVLFEAEGGADICALLFEACQFTALGKGIKVKGSNALDPVVLASWFSSCGEALDFSEGGSNLSVVACGGSYCETFCLVKAGYQGRLDVTSFEGRGEETFLRIGGDDAGGFGSLTALTVTANDVRTVKTFADLNCSGSVALQAHKASGSIRGENKSSAVCGLALSGATGKLPQAMTGKFEVKVQ